jgi:phytoene dehydrogenase-like protein
MARRYDVIVVGGGISGTIRAARFAKAGKKVALLEATDRVGGP